MTRFLPRFFILVTVVIDALGIGLILPVIPNLLVELEGGSIRSAALWGGALTTLFAVMQFLCGPIIGSLSDRFGRRPVMLMSLLVMSIDCLVTAFAPSIWFVVAARGVAGMAAATHTTAYACFADISEEGEEAKNFGLLGAAFGLGFIMGPVVGGLLGQSGPRAPFLCAGILAALNMMFGFLVMPETVSAANRRAFDWKRANPVGAFLHLGRMKGMIGLMCVAFINAVAFYVFPSVWAYYSEMNFGWSPAMIGISLSTFGVALFIVQGVFIRIIVPKLGEYRTVIIGFAVDIISFAVIALATHGWNIFALAPFSAFGAIAGPALNGLASQRVHGNEQGELQGLFQSVSAVGMIVGPLIMTTTFYHFTSPVFPVRFPGAPFALASVLQCLALALFVSLGLRKPS